MDSPWFIKKPRGNYVRLMRRLADVWETIVSCDLCLVSHHLILDTRYTHFLQVSWGPIMPAGETSFMVEATKGLNSYYLVSDQTTSSYRTRIRTPSFAHLQQIPSAIRGQMVPDLIAYIASIDFVMADVDR